MPATTVIPAAQVQPAARTTPAPVLSLEARMAAVDAAMTIRLEEASLANDINTAHIATEPVDLADVIRGPVDSPRTPVDLYPTPVAALLQRALQRLTRDGWCGHTPTTSVPGPDCLQSAIYKEARGNYGLASEGLDVLLDAIRRQFTNADSVPGFNDAWGRPTVPLRLLDQAADLAGSRNI
jgi:hypothetical protein